MSVMKKRSTFGWVEFIVGVLLVIFGIYVFRNPMAGLSGAVAVYGTVAIIIGIADIVFYVQLQKRTGFGPVSSLIAGIFSIILGLLLVLNIGFGAVVLSLLFPIWFIVHCVSRLANLGFVRIVAGSGAYWTTLIVNILGIVLGFALLFDPFASGYAVAYIIGIYLVLSGAGSIATAFSKLGEKRY